MEVFICPCCGKKDMIKKILESNQYLFICKTCGYCYGTLPVEHSKYIF